MTQTQDDMAGKVAIVTGGSGGIGQATAALLLARGANVMLAARNADKLSAAAEELGGGEQLAHRVCDIGDEAQVRALIEATTEKFSQLDILIANAGTEGTVKPLLDLTLEEFSTVQRINIDGTFLCIKHGAQAMLERGAGGAIVATGSVASVVGVPGLGAYAPSKHAIAGLVQVAALELAESGVRINAVAPAPIDNAMMRSIEGMVAPPEARAEAEAGFAALNPMKRYGKNEEVAAAIAFLASDAASFVNGAVLPVDGGFLAA
ncbi:MAG: SDR family NAD(P)-dependent oxidoreductase [Pseudomonadota bacterium]